MEVKKEGAVIRPVPLGRGRPREGAGPWAAGMAPDSGDPRCEVCGAPVFASHCKRICLKCGFMTGCSEGI